MYMEITAARLTINFADFVLYRRDRLGADIVLNGACDAHAFPSEQKVSLLPIVAARRRGPAQPGNSDRVLLDRPPSSPFPVGLDSGRRIGEQENPFVKPFGGGKEHDLRASLLSTELRKTRHVEFVSEPSQ